jgi:heterodisulfide reductase subunit D
MERIREYSWCCGAGGGVLEAFPDFATWTATERLEEALATGAEALVTACPWCVRVFRDAAAEASIDLPVHDLVDLALRSAGLLDAARA